LFCPSHQLQGLGAEKWEHVSAALSKAFSPDS
jgi:hypothetical protein